jgi:hypothetical protein
MAEPAGKRGKGRHASASSRAKLAGVRILSWAGGKNRRGTSVPNQRFGTKEGGGS